MTDELTEKKDDAQTVDNGKAYGRMRAEFPGWDPYVYGKPEERKADDERKARRGARNPFAPDAQPDSARQNAPVDSDEQNAQNQQAPGIQFYNMNGQPLPIQEFDPDDPKKNPLYGRWDFYAVLAFIGAFFSATAPLALFFGILSLGRTRRLHMKGRALAIVALVLCAAQIGLYIYLMVTNTTEVEFARMLLEWAQGQLQSLQA
ncbi:DUF4190 domain-containing protein [Alloscardovia macacae]|uniref:DUF4190 domain-containing protein n=1 Tax=Alloscardovia macacae TaxID=1160091 RepID=A0A261F394_9BIFI|nr:DUF4190 domain-containing protein [Alloscardovia macacae]OZG53599.1 hypothetical protein ALMA_1164 [Alloscardovia macacae]